MRFLLINGRVSLALSTSLLLSMAVYAAQEPIRGGPPAQAVQYMRISPILNAIDVDHDGVIVAAELANAPGRLKSLDKNGDGKLTRDEFALTFGAPRGRGGEGGRGADAGGGEGERSFEVPIPGPTAAELLAALLSYDKNKDGKLTKKEVPARQQGIFERGDTDKNGVLDAAELRKLTEDQAKAPVAPPVQRGGRGGPGGPGGPGGFGGLDLASTALDTDHNGEISAEEIANAATSLKTLDKNNDGSITEDEVRPAAPGRGPGQ